MKTRLLKALSSAGVVWALIGITMLLGAAILRLTPHALEAVRFDLTFTQWSALIVWCLFMLFTEGYHGFQRAFAPRIAARAWHLYNSARPIDLILAPFYCIGYYCASPKRMVINWVVAVVIIGFVLFVRSTDQPWRGIIDFGVVLGLSYGLTCVYVFFLITFKKRSYQIDPDIN
jgi:hypothetical protein